MLMCCLLLPRIYQDNSGTVSVEEIMTGLGASAALTEADVEGILEAGGLRSDSTRELDLPTFTSLFASSFEFLLYSDDYTAT